MLQGIKTFRKTSFLQKRDTRSNEQRYNVERGASRKCAGSVGWGPREGFLEEATFQVHLKMAGVPKAETGSTWLEQRYKDRARGRSEKGRAPGDGVI